jgi:hypothetical protein
MSLKQNLKIHEEDCPLWLSIICEKLHEQIPIKTNIS